jgi:phage host-nuclease inhibitor protein Gam
MTEEIAVPDSVADLAVLAEVFARAGREARRLEARRDERIAKIKTFYDEKLAPLNNAVELSAKLILDYAEEHKELFSDKKTVELVHAVLKRVDSDELVVADEEAVVAKLKELKRDKDTVKTVESVIREPIKKDPKLIEQIDGLSLMTNWNFTLSAKPRPAEAASKEKPIERKRKVPAPPDSSSDAPSA